MTRLAVLAIATLGCASAGVDLSDASPMCPDAHVLVSSQADELVTLGCEARPGVPDGPAIVWDREAMQLVSIVYFEDGKLHGPARTWHSNGQLWTESHYEHGSNQGELRHWHANGQLEVRAHYEDDKLEGAWIQWRDDGSLRRLWHWHQGEMHGPYIVWHPNGRAKIIGRYEHDTKVGQCLFWNEAGDLERTEEQPAVPASAD